MRVLDLIFVFDFFFVLLSSSLLCSFVFYLWLFYVLYFAGFMSSRQALLPICNPHPPILK